MIALDMFIWDNGLKINGKFTYQFFSTYGFPPEMLAEEVNNHFPPNSKEKAFVICQAYDTKFGTNYTPRYLELFNQGCFD